MKLNYHPDTDSLYIDLSERVSTESREISEGRTLIEKSWPGKRTEYTDNDNHEHELDDRQPCLTRAPPT
jgi:hypothetical protein